MTYISCLMMVKKGIMYSLALIRNNDHLAIERGFVNGEVSFPFFFFFPKNCFSTFPHHIQRVRQNAPFWVLIGAPTFTLDKLEKLQHTQKELLFHGQYDGETYKGDGVWAVAAFGHGTRDRGRQLRILIRKEDHGNMREDPT